MFLPAKQQPFGLTSGNTYYVVNENAHNTSFELANSPNGAPITDLNVTNSMGTGYSLGGVPGVLLTSAGKGTQYLVLVLNTSGANANGTYQLAGGGAGTALNAPPGDGLASAGSIGSGGGGVEIGGSDATVTSSPTVDTYAGGGATLMAGGDITIMSTSYANTGADGSNSGGGFVAVGGGGATLTVNNTDSATVNDGTVNDPTVINAGGNFTLEAVSFNSVTGSSDSSGGGLVSVGSATTTANVDPDTLASVGQNAQVTASSALLVESETTTTGNIAATANGAGFGVAPRPTPICTWAVMATIVPWPPRRPRSAWAPR